MKIDSNYLLALQATGAAFDPELYSMMRYELDHHMYSFGRHFRRPLEREVSVKEKLRSAIASAIAIGKHSLSTLPDLGNVRVLSSAYSTFNNELHKIGIDPVWPPWSRKPGAKVIPSYKMSIACEKVKNALRYWTFRSLASKSFYDLVDDYRSEFLKACQQHDLKALFVAQDLSFFERLAIDSFKQMNLPTFVMLHGLPGQYNSIDDNRADYLIVWGEKLRKNYIDNGVDPQKIFVAGHPSLRQRTGAEKLRFSFENILVLTTSTNGSPHSTGFFPTDRGTLIAHLCAIQNVLNKFGVKKVKLRPHPSENPSWYFQFIDPNFFSLDDAPLNETLRKATLVIGPSSTIVLEAIHAGVNYVLFEQSTDRIRNVTGFKLVPPFDDSEPRLPLACNQQELIEILETKKTVDSSFFSDYVKADFGLEFLQKLVTSKT